MQCIQDPAIFSGVNMPFWLSHRILHHFRMRSEGFGIESGLYATYRLDRHYQDVATPTLQDCASASERLAGITAKFPRGQLTAVLGTEGCGSGALLGAGCRMPGSSRPALTSKAKKLPDTIYRMTRPTSYPWWRILHLRWPCVQQGRFG